MKKRPGMLRLSWRKGQKAAASLDSSAPVPSPPPLDAAFVASIDTLMRDKIQHEEHAAPSAARFPGVFPGVRPPPPPRGGARETDERGPKPRAPAFDSGASPPGIVPGIVPGHAPSRHPVNPVPGAARATARAPRPDPGPDPGPRPDSGAPLQAQGLVESLPNHILENASTTFDPYDYRSGPERLVSFLRRLSIRTVLGRLARVCGLSGLALLVLTATIGGGLVLSGRLTTETLVAFLSERSSFVVDHIYVYGRGRLERHVLRELVEIDRGAPIFLIDLEAVQRRLLSHPLILEADVARHWPDKLVIRLLERQPVAVAQTPLGPQLVDRMGTVMGRPADPDEAQRLPVLVGEGGLARFSSFFAQLEPFLELRRHIGRIEWVEHRRWRLYTWRGTLIELEEAHPAHSLASLNWLRELEGDLLSQSIGRIDLRDGRRAYFDNHDVQALPAAPRAVPIPGAAPQEGLQNTGA